MTDKDKAATPLVEAHEDDAPDRRPTKVDPDAPVSTDANGEVVPFPDLGGKID